MTTNAQGAKPILLAFSGGLDTSFCVPWLAETYGRPIVTLTVNTGASTPKRPGCWSNARSSWARSRITSWTHAPPILRRCSST